MLSHRDFINSYSPQKLKKPRLNILLVDDEPEITRLAASLLQASGHAADVTNNGQEALDAFAAKEPAYYDLVVTDCSMPKVTGPQLIKQIRENGFKGRIIVASGFVTAEVENALRRQVIDQIIHKPFLMTDLCEAVETLSARMS